MDVQKITKGTPFCNFSPQSMRLTMYFKKIRNFFPHSGTVEESTRHLEFLLLILSLRYGTALGRSRLVSTFSIQFGGFSEQHQGNKRPNFHEIFQVFAGRSSIFVSADAAIGRKQILYVSQCGKQIRINGTYFKGKLFKRAKFITSRDGQKEKVEKEKLQSFLGTTFSAE